MLMLIDRTVRVKVAHDDHEGKNLMKRTLTAL
jgi:hypothetical protein